MRRLAHIPADARALVLVDTRLHELICAGVVGLCAGRGGQAEIRPSPCCRWWDWTIAVRRRSAEAIQSWHAERPKVEGILFVGNVKLPSFFMPRGDTLSVRLWSKYYEDLEMEADARDAAGLDADLRAQGVQGARARLRPDAPSARPARRCGRPSSPSAIRTTPRIPTRTGPNNWRPSSRRPPPSTAAPSPTGGGCTCSPTTGVCWSGPSRCGTPSDRRRSSSTRSTRRAGGL